MCILCAVKCLQLSFFFFELHFFLVGAFVLRVIYVTIYLKKIMYSLHLNNNLVTLQITIMGACVLFGVPALVTIIKT